MIQIPGILVLIFLAVFIAVIAVLVGWLLIDMYKEVFGAYPDWVERKRTEKRRVR